MEKVAPDMIERRTRMSLKQIEQRFSEIEASEKAPPSLLEELTELHREWAYPRGLEHRAGFLYSDLCEKLGELLLASEQPEEALAVWRECPWPSVAAKEKRALAQVLQMRVDEKTLLLAPPVSALLAQGKVALGELVGVLDQESTDLVHSSSGRSYLYGGSFARPQGVVRFQVDTDGATLFYVAGMGTEVESRLRTARSYFQMGDAPQAASWLLRAAHAAHGSQSYDVAVSLLIKAGQLDNASEPVRRSLEALTQAGHSETLYSRVLVERQLMQPTPKRRSARRPERLPESGIPSRGELECRLDSARSELQAGGIEWVTDGGANLSIGVAGEGRLPDLLVQWGARELAEDRKKGMTLALLTPECRSALDLDYERFEERFQRTLALGSEGAARWNGDLRAGLTALLQEWEEGEAQDSPGLPTDLLGEERLVPVYFGLEESWQLPLLLEEERSALPSVEFAGWLRRLFRRFGGRLVGLSLDAAVLYLPELPELPLEKSRLLADLLNVSPDLEEAFDPNHLHRLQSGYLLCLPLGVYPDKEVPRFP